MKRAKTPAAITDLAAHIEAIRDRDWLRGVRNMIYGSCSDLGPPDAKSTIDIPPVPALRLEGPMVKVVAKDGKVQFTLLTDGNLAWWKTKAMPWVDGAVATVKPGDEVVVEAIVRRNRESRGGGRFLALTTPKLVSIRRRGTRGSDAVTAPGPTSEAPRRDLVPLLRLGGNR